MDIEEIREYCLNKKGVSEELPFGPDTLVFKVVGKMFALTPLDASPLRISLKNTPDKNEELRAEFDFIQGAYHMNKMHWSMILIDGRAKSAFIKQLIDESYDLVVHKLTKKEKELLYSTV